MSTSRHQPALSNPARPILRVSPSAPERSAPTLPGTDARPLSHAAWNSFEIRPIVPADAELIVAAIAYTSSDTYYRRFHVAKRQFSRNELISLTEVDGRTHVALVAIEAAKPARLAAEARFCIDPSDSREGELGICVHDPFRRLGLAAEMLRRLCACAGPRGVTRLRAIVQADNIPMRALLYQVFPDTRIGARYEGEIDYLIPLPSLIQGSSVSARTDPSSHPRCRSRTAEMWDNRAAGRREQTLDVGNRNGAVRVTRAIWAARSNRTPGSGARAA